MEGENSGPVVYSVEEARKILRLSRGLMYEAIHNGQIPSVKVGRRILIPVAALNRFLDGTAAMVDEKRSE